MNPSPENPMLQQTLQQLHDIQTPEAPGLWPPAPGWYVVAALLAVILLWAGRKLWKWIRYRLWLWRAQQQLPRPVAGPEYFAALNIALKTAVDRRFAEFNPWPLSGSQWVDFLYERAPEMDQQALEQLVINGIKPNPELNPERAHTIAREWLRRQRP